MIQVAQIVIFIACMVAFLRVPQSFHALIFLRKITLWSGAIFFLSDGILNLGLALGREDGFVVTLAEIVQAVSIVMFLIWLSKDLLRALRRLRSAFQAIENEYDKDGDRMIATVTIALQGK